MSKIKANTIENVAGTSSHDVANMGIESGSNANGNYTKFPDGTMICTSPELSVQATSEAIGDIFRSPGTTSWTYPEIFIGIPATSISNSANTSWMVVAYGLNYCTFRGFNATSSATAREAILMAVGRWK